MAKRKYIDPYEENQKMKDKIYTLFLHVKGKISHRTDIQLLDEGNFFMFKKRTEEKGITGDYVYQAYPIKFNEFEEFCKTRMLL